MATTKPASKTEKPADGKPARKPAAKAAAAKVPAPTARAPEASAAKAPAKPAARKSSAAKPAAPRAAPKSAPRKPAAKPAAKAAPKATSKPAAAARPAPSLPSRALGAFSIGAAVVAVGAAIVEAVRRLRGGSTEGHEAPDLALDQPHPDADSRAPDAFRPDPAAEVPASEREALRPATTPLGSGRELDSVH